MFLDFLGGWIWEIIDYRVFCRVRLRLFWGYWSFFSRVRLWIGFIGVRIFKRLLFGWGVIRLGERG